jgi:chromosome segregation ATPase
MLLQANLKAAKTDLVTMTKRALDAEKVGEQKNDLLEAATREVNGLKELAGTLQTELTIAQGHKQKWEEAWKGGEDPADLRRQFDALQKANAHQGDMINGYQSANNSLAEKLMVVEVQHEKDAAWFTDIRALAEAHGWNTLDGSLHSWIGDHLNQLEILKETNRCIQSRMLSQGIECANATNLAEQRKGDLIDLRAEVERLRTVEGAAEISDTERRVCQQRAEAAETQLEEAQRHVTILQGNLDDALARVHSLDRLTDEQNDAMKALEERGDQHMAKAGLLAIQLAEAKARLEEYQDQHRDSLECWNDLE